MPYLADSSTKNRRIFCNFDDAGDEYVHLNPVRINNNQYGNSMHHHRSVAPHHPSIAAAAADFALYLLYLTVTLLRQPLHPPTTIQVSKTPLLLISLRLLPSTSVCRRLRTK